MHVGHAAAALVTWCRARERGGTIAMRIEDIDGPRVVDGSAEQILVDHRWLGLDWDDGPVYQSSRFARYNVALDKLQQAGLVYRCSCSRADVAQAASAPHGPGGLVYPGTCRGGPTQPERPQTWRFKMPEPAPPFDDELCGPQRDADPCGDFVVQRADGQWSYQLAVVVDDAEMGVTEVVRGRDLLSSTPRQIALHNALGYKPPAFAHVPLVVDEHGKRLASRHKAIGVGAYRDAGWQPEQVLGALAFGLGMTSRLEACTLESLVGCSLDSKVETLTFPAPNPVPTALL